MKIQWSSDLEYMCGIEIMHEAFRKHLVALVFPCSQSCLLSVESTSICIHKSVRTVGKSSTLMKILIDKVHFQWHTFSLTQLGWHLGIPRHLSRADSFEDSGFNIRLIQGYLLSQFYSFQADFVLINYNNFSKQNVGTGISIYRLQRVMDAIFPNVRQIWMLSQSHVT